MVDEIDRTVTKRGKKLGGRSFVPLMRMMEGGGGGGL